MTYRHNLDTALSILPNLKSGLDVNVKFDNIHGFEPTAELAMFDLFDVDLVHGWVADPQVMEGRLLKRKYVDGLPQCVNQGTCRTLKRMM